MDCDNYYKSLQVSECASSSGPGGQDLLGCADETGEEAAGAEQQSCAGQQGGAQQGKGGAG